MKTKIFLLALSLLMLASTLVACDVDTSILNYESFVGTIEKVEENTFLLIKDGEQISATYQLKSEGLKEGDEVIVYYDGIIKETYPAQISAYAILKNNKGSELKKSMNEFAYKTSPLLLKENTNYSPISLYFALSLANEGATNETKEELSSLLGLPENSKENIFDIMMELYEDSENSKLYVNNSLWVEDNLNGEKIVFNEDYLSIVEDYYKGDLFAVNFGRKRTDKEISKWISKNTEGLLKPNIETKEGEIASIINTIYMKDKWLSQFETHNTSKDVFYKNNKEIKLDFMKQKNHFRYHKAKDWSKVELDFEGGGSMFFVLPKAELSNIVNSNLQEIVETQGDTKKVNLVVPKFTISSDIELIPMFKELGIKRAFSDSAEFDGIVHNINIKISNIHQGTKIIVEEGGIEAAAYTKITLDMASMPMPEEVVDFVLNKPFLYGIVDKNGNILFIGTYSGENS